MISFYLYFFSSCTFLQLRKLCLLFFFFFFLHIVQLFSRKTSGNTNKSTNHIFSVAFILCISINNDVEGGETVPTYFWSNEQRTELKTLPLLSMSTNLPTWYSWPLTLNEMSRTFYKLNVFLKKCWQLDARLLTT